MNLPLKPLSNRERIQILQEYLGSSKEYLSDLEKEHFQITSYFPREMREKFKAKISNVYTGSFDSKYDDYLLVLWQENQGAGGAGNNFVFMDDNNFVFMEAINNFIYM